MTRSWGTSHNFHSRADRFEALWAILSHHSLEKQADVLSNPLTWQPKKCEYHAGCVTGMPSSRRIERFCCYQRGGKLFKCPIKIKAHFDFQCIYAKSSEWKRVKTEGEESQCPCSPALPLFHLTQVLLRSQSNTRSSTFIPARCLCVFPKLQPPPCQTRVPLHTGGSQLGQVASTSLKKKEEETSFFKSCCCGIMCWVFFRCWYSWTVGGDNADMDHSVPTDANGPQNNRKLELKGNDGL